MSEHPKNDVTWDLGDVAECISTNGRMYCEVPFSPASLPDIGQRFIVRQVNMILDMESVDEGFITWLRFIGHPYACEAKCFRKVDDLEAEQLRSSTRELESV